MQVTMSLSENSEFIKITSWRRTYQVVDVYRKQNNIKEKQNLALLSLDIMCLPNKIKLTSRTVRYFTRLESMKLYYSHILSNYFILIQLYPLTILSRFESITLYSWMMSFFLVSMLHTGNVVFS